MDHLTKKTILRRLLAGTALAGLALGVTASTAHAQSLPITNYPIQEPGVYQYGTNPGQTQANAVSVIQSINSSLGTVSQAIEQSVTASATTLGQQLQTDQIAQGVLMTQQDQQLATLQKQGMVAQLQTEAQDRYVAPNTNNCAQSIGSGMVGMGAMVGSVSAAPKVASKITSGGAPPGGDPITACTNSNCWGTNTGRKFGTIQQARKAITTEPQKTFLATDSFLPTTQASGTIGLQQMNRFIMAVTNPLPPPNVPTADQGTPAGQQFAATARIKEAGLSLSQAAMLRIGVQNLPSLQTSVLESAQSAGGTLSASGNTFTALLDADATANGTPGFVSQNQAIKAYATSFAMNPNFYTKVPTIAANATSYREYMLMFTSMQLYLAYTTDRTLQYMSAIQAGGYAGHLDEHYDPILTQLKAQAVSNRAGATE